MTTRNDFIMDTALFQSVLRSHILRVYTNIEQDGTYNEAVRPYVAIYDFNTFLSNVRHDMANAWTTQGHLESDYQTFCLQFVENLLQDAIL